MPTVISYAKQTVNGMNLFLKVACVQDAETSYHHVRVHVGLPPEMLTQLVAVQAVCVLGSLVRVLSVSALSVCGSVCVSVCARPLAHDVLSQLHEHSPLCRLACKEVCTCLVLSSICPALAASSHIS